MDFEFIDETDMESVKRGRKTTVPAELVRAHGLVDRPVRGIHGSAHG